MLLPTSAFAEKTGAAAFGAVVRAIRFDRKTAPDENYRADQKKRDGHDLENSFHSRGLCVPRRLTVDIGTICGSLSVPEKIFLRRAEGLIGSAISAGTLIMFERRVSPC